MPAPVESSKKRKSVKNGGAPSKRRAVAEEDTFAETLSKIQELENQITESRKHYNNIATLISMLNVEPSAKEPELAVAVSLCRVFSRLIAAGNLTESNRAAENEKIIVAWLKERCLEYQRALMAIMREADPTSQITALTLAMRLVKERITHIPGADNNIWATLFKDIVTAVVEANNGQDLQTEFVSKFVKEFEDVRFFTFVQLAYVNFPSSLDNPPNALDLTNHQAVNMPTCEEAPKPLTLSSRSSPPATMPPPPTTNLNPSSSPARPKPSNSTPSTPTRNEPRKHGSPSCETTSPKRNERTSSASWSTTSSPGSADPS